MVYKFRDIVVPIIIGIVVSILITISVRLTVINGESMSPTLDNGQKVLILTNKMLMGLNRGDIVVVDSGFQEKPTVSYYIKRIIGMPGDTVEINNRQVLINGEPLSEEYLKGPMDDKYYSFDLGENEYFVMGDNRNNSIDSRNFGPVNKDYIYGKVLFK